MPTTNIYIYIYIIYRLTRMCSLRPLWASVVLNGLNPPPARLPYVGPIDDSCVRLEAALCRIITV